jgi:hypothetical protein
MNTGVNRFSTNKSATKATVQAKYSKKYQDEYFLENGVYPNVWKHTYKSNEIDKDLRAALVDLGWFGFSTHVLCHSAISSTRDFKPSIGYSDTIEFDHLPSEEEVEEIIKELACEMRLLKSELNERVEKWRRETEAQKRVEEKHKERRELEKAELEEKRIAEAQTVKPVDDLYQKLMIVSGLEADDRFSNWIKFVDTVNAHEPGAYMFEGDFLREGTVEVVPERQLFLVATTSGSRKYQTTHYCLIEKTAQGKLIKQHVENDRKQGWALRMRPHVETLLGINTEPMIIIPVTILQEAIDAIGSDYHTELIEQLEHYLK